MSTLLSVSIAVLAGLLMTRVFNLWRLPDVTAYLVAGVLIGPSVLGSMHITGLGLVSAEAVSSLHLVSEVALGFIAFSIGNEFRLEDLKSTGNQAAIIGVVQALTATLLVDTALLTVHMLLPEKLSAAQAITLGAIATATAPAATLMVVRQYKAKGPVTNLLLPIVALDDAVGLIVFAVSFGISKALVSGELDLISILLNPLLEIVASLALGAAAGWLLTKLEVLFHSNTNRLNMTISLVFLTVALSMSHITLGPVTISFSSLLVCMMLGTVFCNLCPQSADLMKAADNWTSPLFALFFVCIGLVYILFRSAGKYIGAFASSKYMKCGPEICKYLGITLLPQAGVALGMCTTAMQLGEQGGLIRNLTLFSVLIYEMVGPLLTRQALMAAGDIQPLSAEVCQRRPAQGRSAKRSRA